MSNETSIRTRSAKAGRSLSKCSCPTVWLSFAKGNSPSRTWINTPSCCGAAVTNLDFKVGTVVFRWIMQVITGSFASWETKGELPMDCGCEVCESIKNGTKVMQWGQWPITFRCFGRMSFRSTLLHYEAVVILQARLWRHLVIPKKESSPCPCLAQWRNQQLLKIGHTALRLKNSRKNKISWKIACRFWTLPREVCPSPLIAIPSIPTLEG